MFDLTLNQLVLVFSLAAIGHLLLIPLANRWGILVTLVGLFFIFSPLSTATGLPGFQLFKYGRLYVALLAILLGLIFGVGRLGGATKLMIGFIVLYVGSAAWGPSAVHGVAFKGLTLVAILAGVVAAQSIHTTGQLLRAMQLFLIAGGVMVLIVLANFAISPGTLMQVGRLTVWGINPNMLGQVVGLLAVVAMYFALFYPTRGYRIIGWIIGGTLLVVVIYTGSRGSLGVVAIAGLVMSANLVKKMGRLFIAAILGFVILSVAMQQIAASATSRLTEVNLNTRTYFWANAWDIFVEHPMMGVGWTVAYGARATGSTINHLSIYLQTLVEVGILGGIVLTGVLVLIGLSIWKSRRAVAKTGPLSDLWFLNTALLAALLAHGAAESSILMGSSINTVLFGFSVALCDRFGPIARNDQLLLQNQASWTPARPPQTDWAPAAT